MNPEAQYRRYKPDYTGMNLREMPFTTLPNHRGIPTTYKLDIITAPNPADGPCPVVFFIHGGAFIQPNDKRQAYICLFARELTTAGYTVISPDYPVFDDEAHLASCGGEAAGYHLAAQGIHEAYCFACKNATDLGLTPDHIAIIGGSAGAMAGFYAISDYPEDRYVAFVNLWGAPDPLPAMNGFPPIYSVHGDADDVVPFGREAAVQKILDHHKIPNSLCILPGSGHTPLGRMADFWPDVMTFLRKYLTEG